jgi:hypothetical protein
MQFRSLRPDGVGGWVDELAMQNGQGSFTCIGEDADGELYTGNLGAGKLYKIIDRCPMDPPSITQVGADLQSSAANSYQWFFNGDTIPGATGQTHAPTQTGQYFVVADMGNLCVLTSDTIDFIFVGLHAVGSTELTIAPVPVDEVLMVQWRGGDVGIWRLVNASGRILVSGRVEGERFAIATGDLAEGTHLLQLCSMDGVVRAARQVTILH